VEYNILCMDIGKGTQDILYIRKENVDNLENSVKLILPSPTTILSNKIKNMREDLYIDGYIMGGGPVNRAINEHLKKGYNVYISERAARTIRDNLDEVSEMGVSIVSRIDSPNIIFKDIDFNMLKSMFKSFGEDFKPDYVLVGCQDHGYVPNQSDRITRFNYFRDILNKNKNPKTYLFDKIENCGYFSRFKSILSQLNNEGYRGFVMDSKICSVCGINHYAESIGIDEFVGLDIGNGHTLGVSIKKGLVYGLFEHHTRMLSDKKLDGIVKKLINGTLKNEEIFNEGGHGASVVEGINPKKIFISGPNRGLFKNYGVYAYPGGDVMITGCVGLFDAFKHWKGINYE